MWYNEMGKDSDVVVSSRVRLARNLKDTNFINRLTIEDAEKILKDVRSAVKGTDLDFIEMKDIDNLNKTCLVEKNLISPEFKKRSKGCGVILNKESTLSIMVNEEDHLRIQSIKAGNDLNQALEECNKIDDLLDEKLNYAFDEQFGYLTSCPTNVGTGMRASLMVHLPALTMTGYINQVLDMAGKIGLTIRGSYGEGSEPTGNIYQISNKSSLGLSEKDIITNVNAVAEKIIEKERLARKQLMKNPIVIEDRLMRAYGILTNARILSSNECINLLSDVKLGVELGIIDNIDMKTINSLFVLTRPAMIQLEAKQEIDAGERDIKRAEIVKKHLG